MSEFVAPLVTAVIPTRNRLPWLKQAVDSVLGQEGIRVDVVVVDEGSSDGTPEWLDGFDDQRLRFVRHDEPRRLPGARNAGTAIVESPWVAFLDDDDLWAPTKIRAQLAAAEAVGARWCYAAEVTVDPDLNVIDIPSPVRPEDMPELLPMKNLVPAGGSGVLIQTDLVREVGGFDEDLVAMEDWECWLRVLGRGEMPAAVLEPLVAYRWGAASMSMEVDRMRNAYNQVRDRHPLADPEATRLAWARNERYLAFQLARHSRWRESVASLRLSARVFPARHFVLALWVMATRREWPTRSFRRLGSQASVADSQGWLNRFRAEVVSR